MTDSPINLVVGMWKKARKLDEFTEFQGVKPLNHDKMY